MRSGVVLVVIALLVVSCSSDSGSGSGSGAQVEQFDAGVVLSGPPVALGRALLAAGQGSSFGDDDAVPALYRSDDGGETWKPVEPPGLPPGRVVVEVDSPQLVAEGLAAVSARVVSGDPDPSRFPSGDAYVWTTKDGVTWHGGRLTGPETWAGVATHEVDGVLFAATTASTLRPDDENRLEVHRSTDGGASWAPAAIAGVSLTSGQATRVTDIWRDADGRLVAGMESGANPDGTRVPPVAMASEDEGRSWVASDCPSGPVPASHSCQAPAEHEGIRFDVLEPDVAEFHDEENRLRVIGVVELPGGGWLAAVSTDEPGDTSFGFLLRSGDGTRWRTVLPSARCEPDGDGAGGPSSSFTTPLRFGDGWLVAYSCGDEAKTTESRLYVLDADGMRPVEVDGTSLPPNVNYLPPVAVGSDGVVVAVGRNGDHDGDARVVRLRPASS